MSNIYLVRHLDRIDNEDCSLEETKLWNSTFRKEYIYQINPYICKSNNKLELLIKNLGDVKFDHIICSPFLRCVETAILIKNNYPNITNKEININFNLSELICEDFSFTVPLNIQDIYLHTKKYLIEHNSDYKLIDYNTELKFDSYETDEEYNLRIKKAIRDINEKFKGNILIVTHRDALNIGMKYGFVYNIKLDVLDGGYYQKYLKYKGKYLKLKNLIK